jgi:hypothetical protein
MPRPPPSWDSRSPPSPTRGIPGTRARSQTRGWWPTSSQTSAGQNAEPLISRAGADDGGCRRREGSTAVAVQDGRTPHPARPILHPATRRKLAESSLTGNLFRQILQRIERLAWRPHLFAGQGADRPPGPARADGRRVCPRRASV